MQETATVVEATTTSPALPKGELVLGTYEGGKINLGPAEYKPSSLTFLGHNLLEAATFAKVMYQAGVAGPDCKGPQEILARIMLGLEVGVPPMVAIREIYIVKGRPAMSSRLMHTLARRAGTILRYVETSDQRCEVEITPPGGRSLPSRFAWTIDRASKAGLLRNDTWTKYPAQMLRARCVSESINAACPEVLAGGMTSIEELNDLDEKEETGTVKERADARSKEFDRVFATSGADVTQGAPDPFRSIKDRPVHVPGGDPPIPAAPPTIDLSQPTPHEQEVQKKESYYQRRKRRLAEEAQRPAPEPTKLDNGEFAMMRAITQAAERKGLIFVDGRIDVGPFGAKVGLDKNAYSARALAAQVNATEILREIEAYNPAEGLA